jgi:hypothetical protein
MRTNVIILFVAGPEIIESIAEQTATQSDNSIGAIGAPEHARSFKPLPDNHSATGFHHTGANAKAKGTKVGVIHALAVVAEVLKLPCSHGANVSVRRYLTADCL